ncbi:MAG: ATP-binding protein [Tateyamaria sp.]
MNGYRITVLAGICLLVLLLALMVTNLLSQLRDLSRAAEDNMQWSISQLDTEFANLDALLTEQVATGQYPDDTVQLRVDIVLSRLNIINSGRAAQIFGESPEAGVLVAPINTFADAAIALSDAPGPLVGSRLTDMQKLVRDVRPQVRDLALLGVRLGAERAGERRAEFARQLSRTGGLAIVFLILMTILLLALDRLLQRAVRRDAALSASTRQLESTVAASLDAIVTADASGRIVDFNASAERVFGWTRDEIVGRTMEDTFIPHRMRDAHHNGMKRYLETGKPRVVDAGRVELAALRKSGEEFPVELNITTAKNGDKTTFIAYIRDISERKINEQKLIDARDRAERTDKAKSHFLTVMSHEMRTPLNGILGVLDMLKTTPLNDTQARYARIATSSSEVLLEHVNEALDITRVETGELPLNMQDFALTDLMQGLMEMFEPLAREKQLSLTLEIEPAMRGPYHGDAGRIRQILTNLIGNAIKFTEQGGVSLRVNGIHGPQTTSMRFEVSDTGIGIPPEQHEQVFEDFFALAQGEGRQDRGDGLGLSISRRIARAMGGDVSLKSAERDGSTFVLSMPVSRTATPPVTGANDSSKHPVTSTACDILIVEDNTINRSVLSDMLAAMGHTVTEAINGADGVAKASERTFDIIFMDISMPVMDGIEATRLVRSPGGPNADTHIVGLTAHGREEYRESAVAAGMDRFHTKPIRLDALHSVIAEVTSARMPHLEAAHFPGALVEMVDLLGPEKVRTLADRFLTELSELIDVLRADKAPSDTASLAETVHKAKGAATLLGQSDLGAILSDLESDARAGSVTDSENWADTLSASAKLARDSFDAVVTAKTGTH